MDNRKRLDNKGFTLVEMLVVVAIIAVVTGIFTLGFSLISTKHVDQCAKKIQMSLESCRTTTMGKLDAYLHFYTYDGKIIVSKNIVTATGTNSTVSELGGNNLSVKYVVTDGASSSEHTLGSTALEIKFDRASGSLKPYSGSSYISEFIVTNTSGTKTLHVKIDKLTGRVTVE